MKTGKKRRNLTGQKFARLTVLNTAPNLGRWTRWNCVCDCGRKIVIRTQAVTSGNTKSCGCFKKEVLHSNKFNLQHGMHKSSTYRSWTRMKQRCKEKKHYVDRGIKVCRRWHKFENFLADMGERPPGKTINRKDNNKGYYPGNCNWATISEQLLNRRLTMFATIKGITKPLTQWAREFRIQPQLARKRVRKGWSIKRVFNLHNSNPCAAV